MTDNASPKSPKFRKIAGFITGLALCAGALGVVVPAFFDPGPPAPVSRALNIAATETARAAYVENMKKQGYEILPPVTMSEASPSY